MKLFDTSIWMEWVKINFTLSSPKASLVHLQREIKETIEEIESDDPSPLKDNGIPLLEYADCILCLLSSASMQGYTAEEVLSALENKANINMNKREWIYNGDGTYRHKK